MKITFCHLLTILFIGLKLSDIINWSWFWVLSPMLIPFLISFAFALIKDIYRIFFETEKQKKFRKLKESSKRASKYFN